MSRVVARLTAVDLLLLCAIAVLAALTIAAPAHVRHASAPRPRHCSAVDIAAGLLCGIAIAVTARPAHRAVVALVPLRDRAERAVGGAAC